MKTIDISGIPFTMESIEALRTYIMPGGESAPPTITSDIKSLNNIQSFVMKIWEELDPGFDADIKQILIGIECIKENLGSILIREGGES